MRSHHPSARAVPDVTRTRLNHRSKQIFPDDGGYDVSCVICVRRDAPSTVRAGQHSEWLTRSEMKAVRVKTLLWHSNKPRSLREHRWVSRHFARFWGRVGQGNRMPPIWLRDCDDTSMRGTHFASPLYRATPTQRRRQPERTPEQCPSAVHRPVPDRRGPS